MVKWVNTQHNVYPLKKKDKDEKHDQKTAPAKIKEEEFSMIVEIPPGGRWDDLELQFERIEVGQDP